MHYVLVCVTGPLTLKTKPGTGRSIADITNLVNCIPSSCALCPGASVLSNHVDLAPCLSRALKKKISNFLKIILFGECYLCYMPNEECLQCGLRMNISKYKEIFELLFLTVCSPRRYEAVSHERDSASKVYLSVSNIGTSTTPVL
jgi:hypothetical protein